MTMNRQWLLHERPVGMIGPEHFKYVESDISEPGDGEVLIRNLMFSFDPTQRCLLYTSPSPRDS